MEEQSAQPDSACDACDVLESQPAPVPDVISLRIEALSVFVLLIVVWSFAMYSSQPSLVTSGSTLPTEFTIDLNDATNAELQLLPGVGDKLAADILRYRSDHDGFTSVAELKKIRGIKEARFRSLSKHLTLNGSKHR
jgi:competence ComEA-like helix-hairpin-helix protein